MNIGNTPLRWKRSSRCDAGNCIEVAVTAEGVAVRDSKRQDGPVLTFSAEEWNAFVAGVRAGEFTTD